jgi:hypothetical protein
MNGEDAPDKEATSLDLFDAFRMSLPYNNPNVT